MDYRLRSRPPVQEERELIYICGYDPTEWRVLSRLNDIMTICRGDEIRRLSVKKRKEICGA